jgi:glycosyltransferase involved in cell wall biosynthesis
VLFRSTENAFFLKLLIRITYPYVNGVICVSNGVLEDIITMGRLKRDKIKVIYNPVTNDRFNNDIVNEIPNFWRDCSFKILSIGRFVSQKNHALLLNAFCILRKSLDVKLIILGDGPLYLQTKEYLNKLGLVDSVIMPGFTTDTNPFYYHSNLFVLSSNFEGLPTVLIEALDYGISIVSTDCPSGPSEILSNGTYGTLVPVGDAKKLAIAMQESLLNPRDKISLKDKLPCISSKLIPNLDLKFSLSSSDILDTIVSINLLNAPEFIIKFLIFSRGPESDISSISLLYWFSVIMPANFCILRNSSDSICFMLFVL